MRIVALLVLLGTALLAIGGWYLEKQQARRLAEGVHLLALNKFEPFLGPWLRLHAEDLEHPVTVDFVHARRFRWEMQQDPDAYDALLVDVFEGTATRLRKDGRVGSYFGGPLKLLVREDSVLTAARRSLQDALLLLRGGRIAVIPEDTPLGADSRAWLDEESSQASPAITLVDFDNGLDVLKALRSGDCQAAILRADLQEASGTRVLAWRFLEGKPEDHFAPGLILPPRNPKRDDLVKLWLALQPALQEFRSSWTPEGAQ